MLEEITMDIMKLKEWLLNQMSYERRESAMAEDEADYEYHKGQAEAYDSVYCKILQMEKGK